MATLTVKIPNQPIYYPPRSDPGYGYEDYSWKADFIREYNGKELAGAVCEIEDDEFVYLVCPHCEEDIGEFKLSECDDEHDARNLAYDIVSKLEESCPHCGGDIC